MSTVYPGALDTFTNPTAVQPQNAPSHSSQHANINDAMVAVQTKIGVNGSADTSSIDYLVNALTSSITALASAVVLRANNLSDLADIPTARSNLSLVPGTNVEAWSALLDSLAALSYAGNAGKAVRVNGAENNFELYTPSSATGDVTGPSSATDNGIARFDLTTGKIIQNSPLTVADTTGEIAGFNATGIANTRTNLGVGTGDSPQFAEVNIGHASDTTLTRVSAGLVAVAGTQLARGTGTASGTNTGDQTLPTRASLGLDTTDSPQFTAINLGHASDTTLTRTGAGDVAVEGKGIYREDGTDVKVADGGTNISSYTKGDILAATGTTTLDKVAVGTGTGTTTGQVLESNSSPTTGLAWSWAGVPIGAIIPFGGSSPPSGWLLCDGSAVSRSTYSRLFGVISTTFGVGNGSTTFNVPDLRGRDVIGAGTGSGLTARTLAATGGAETHALTSGENAAHTHTVGGGGAAGQMPTTIAANTPGALPASGNVITVTGTVNTGSSGSGTAHNNMQPFLVLTPIIYANV